MDSLLMSSDRAGQPHYVANNSCESKMPDIFR